MRGINKQYRNLIEKILKDGTEKTRQTARETMRKVKKAMRLDYFEGE